MGSLLRSVQGRKRKKCFGEVEVIDREQYAELELDAKVELIRSLIPLGLIHVQDLLTKELQELAGARYARKDEEQRGRRHGSNPGSIRLGGQRIPIRVPRVRSADGGEIPLRSYGALSTGGDLDELLMKRVLFGISCRNYGLPRVWWTPFVARECALGGPRHGKEATDVQQGLQA